VWGAALDYRVNLAELFGFQGQAFGFAGEVYTGQALGNYNGGVLQTLDAVTWKPIRTTGGWIEAFVYWMPTLHSHDTEPSQQDRTQTVPRETRSDRSATVRR
jgi:hypothetical protein